MSLLWEYSRSNDEGDLQQEYLVYYFLCRDPEHPKQARVMCRNSIQCQDQMKRVQWEP